MSFFRTLKEFFFGKNNTKHIWSNNKKAIMMGLNNYKGSKNDLKGCVSDAKDISEMLEFKFGFSKPILLIDNDLTVSNVKSHLTKLVEESKSGDVLVISYSGHGSNVADKSGDESDGRDETWYIYDGQLIDDDLRTIFSKLPEGVKLTIISDSCHSGTVTRSLDEYNTPKYIPPEDGAFPVATKKIKRIGDPRGDMNHILISGCSSNEYSYDARIDGSYHGAFTYYLLAILKSNDNITYNKFYEELRRILPNASYKQTPQLEGTEALKEQKMFE